MSTEAATGDEMSGRSSWARRGPAGCLVAAGLAYAVVLATGAATPTVRATPAPAGAQAPAHAHGGDRVVTGGVPAQAVPAAFTGTTVLSESFDSGATGWTMSGLWHLEAGNGGQIARYANASGAAAGTYDTGQRTSGALTSPAFTLQGAGNQLTFTTHEEVEVQQGGTDGGASVAGYDRRQVQVSTDGGTSWQVVADSRLTQTAGAPFQKITLGLDAFAPAGGATAQAMLRFFFDSVDAASNAFYGWGVDDVAVTHAPVPVQFGNAAYTKLGTGPIGADAAAGRSMLATVRADGLLLAADLDDAGNVTGLVTPAGAPALVTGARPGLVHVASPFGSRETVYAAGTDGLLYHADRPDGGAWSTLSARTDVTGATARLGVGAVSLADPRFGAQPVAVYVRTDSYVFSTLGPSAPSNLTARLGLAPAAATGVPAVIGLGPDRALVAVPAGTPSRTVLAVVTSGTVTRLRDLPAPLGVSFVRYGGVVHAVYADYSGQLHDLELTDAGTVIADYDGLRRGLTTRPDLAVHRGQLYASWLEGSQPKVARLDGATAGARWVLEYTGRGTVSSAPAVLRLPSGGLSAYVATSVGRTAVYDGSSWTELAGLSLGTETLRPIDSPGGTVDGAAEQVFYALDDGRIARSDRAAQIVLAAPPSLYGAESGPAVARLSATSTMLSYEAGDRLAVVRIPDGGSPARGTVTLPGGYLPASPPAAVALAGGGIVDLLVRGIKTGAPDHLFVTQVTSASATAVDLGGLPGGGGVLSAPVAVQQPDGHVRVLVIGADGAIYGASLTGTTGGFGALPGGAGPYQGGLGILQTGTRTVVAAVGRQYQDVSVADLTGLGFGIWRPALNGASVQYHPALAADGAGAIHLFATTDYGSLIEQVVTAAPFPASVDRGVPPTAGAPSQAVPTALLPDGDRLFGLRPAGSHLQALDVKAAGLHERLGTLGFETLWHPNDYYPQPETALDQTYVWNESAYVAEKLPEAVNLRYLRDVAAQFYSFEHVRQLIRPVYVGRPYVGSRPYRNISFGDDADTARQWEEFGHDLTVWLGTNPGERVVYQALAADTAAVTEMRTIFSNTGNCTQITANGGVGDYGQDQAGRYRGFVTLAGSYQCTSYGHMFIYPFLQYGTDGTTTRAEVAGDLVAGVDMLQRKYRWIQQWIYGGRQFSTDGEPVLG